MNMKQTEQELTAAITVLENLTAELKTLKPGSTSYSMKSFEVASANKNIAELRAKLTARKPHSPNL